MYNLFFNLFRRVYKSLPPKRWYWRRRWIQLQLQTWWDWRRIHSKKLPGKSLYLKLISLPSTNQKFKGNSVFICLSIYYMVSCGLIGLGAMWSPQDPRFVGSNFDKSEEFFRTLGCGSQVWRFTELLKNLKHKKKGLWANLICHIHVLIIPQFLPKWS